MKKEIEQWIKTSIREWLAADGIESVIKIRFQDTEFSDVVDIVSGTIKDTSDNGTLAVNSIEADVLYDLLMEYALKHAQETFTAVMGELRLLHDTMIASITRTLA
ncbi:MAG: hypothetical protein WCR46_15705 [Deltaproteobacteria bacterium]|jgi:hypothetical protein